MTELLSNINRVLLEPRIDIGVVKNIYHEVLIQNALFTIDNEEPDYKMRYIEEFLRHTIYLCELGFEQDARIQLEAAQVVLNCRY